MLSVPADRSAVLVIECQNDLVHESNIGSKGIGAALARAVRDRDLLARFGRLLSAARTAGIPILYVNKETRPEIAVATGAPIFRLAARRPILIEGSWGAEIHAHLAPQPGDIVVRRFVGIDASYGSNLFATLRALGRSSLIVGGVSTTFAVEGTVRGAVNRRFEVTIAEDCCAGVPEEMHLFSITQVLPLLGAVSTSTEIIAALAT
jgi:ureidoacrylate peracid hydrolase